MNPTADPPPVPTPLRFLAVLTALSALPLAVLGAQVTTMGVGMIDAVGFREPWHLFVIDIPVGAWLAYVVEHGHRLFGYVTGFLSLALAAGMAVYARGGYRWLGLAALAAVASQGILGILRVNQDALYGSEFRVVHGCFAQLAFATLLTVAVISSKAWHVLAPTLNAPLSARTSAGLAVLVYVQIVFGAINRHLLDMNAQRVHILLGIAAVIGVIHLFTRLRREAVAPVVKRFATVMMALAVIQPIFGVEAWIRRFGAGVYAGEVQPSLGLDLARTGHHLIGTVIFCSSVALAVLLHRSTASAAAVEASRKILDALAVANENRPSTPTVAVDTPAESSPVTPRTMEGAA